MFDNVSFNSENIKNQIIVNRLKLAAQLEIAIRDLIAKIDSEDDLHAIFVLKDSKELQAVKDVLGILPWEFIPGSSICCPLSVSGDYVISHRTAQFNVSYRPVGQHIHLGCFTTLEAAKLAAESHNLRERE